MSMIKGYLIGDKAVLARFSKMEPAVMDALRTTIKTLAIKLQRHVKQDKLSGQVLHVRTGLLRGSVNMKTNEDKDGITASVGTNVVYAAIHEYGFDGMETVKGIRAHARRTREELQRAQYSYVNKNGSVVTKLRMTGRYGVQSGSIAVKARGQPFERHMVMPERSYLRSALRDMSGQIQQSLADTLRKAVNAKHT